MLQENFWATQWFHQCVCSVVAAQPTVSPRGLISITTPALIVLQWNRSKAAFTRQRWGWKRKKILSDPWFIYTVRRAKRKSCTPKRKKTKTLAKVEEFENGKVLLDKFGCVNSRNGMLASFSVTCFSFSAVYTDPTIKKIVFIIFVMWRVLFCGLFLECDWCFHDNTWHMTNFCGSFAPV